jgi:hypothetical protein
MQPESCDGRLPETQPPEATRRRQNPHPTRSSLENRHMVTRLDSQKDTGLDNGGSGAPTCQSSAGMTLVDVGCSGSPLKKVPPDPEDQRTSLVK